MVFASFDGIDLLLAAIPQLPSFLMVYSFMRSFVWIILFLVAVAITSLQLRAQAPDTDTKLPATFRVYFIGNSVTDQINYNGLKGLAESRGSELVWGRQMIPGAPLEWLWQHPNDGFKADPFGYPTTALANYTWDAVSFQPFDRGLKSDQEMILNYLNLAKDKDTDTQFYIYERWPRMEGADGRGVSFDKNNFGPNQVIEPVSLAQVADFGAVWNKTYDPTGYGLTNESRDYFEKLTTSMRQATPQLKKPFLIVPVGEVMYQLDLLMKAGKIPGYTSIYQFYADGIHLRPIGQYVAGCTYFAALYKQSPVGLPIEPYDSKEHPLTDADKALVPIIQSTSWNVVSTYPYSGIAASAPPGQ
jgi:hypothetical protein